MAVEKERERLDDGVEAFGRPKHGRRKPGSARDRRRIEGRRLGAQLSTMLLALGFWIMKTLGWHIYNDAILHVSPPIPTISS